MQVLQKLKRTLIILTDIRFHMDIIGQTTKQFDLGESFVYLVRLIPSICFFEGYRHYPKLAMLDIYKQNYPFKSHI